MKAAAPRIRAGASCLFFAPCGVARAKKFLAAAGVAFALCLSGGGVSSAGPFGTQMGDGPEKYPDLAKAPHGFYETSHVPRPHSELHNYQLGFTAGALDRVMAFSEFPRDPEGRKGLPLYNGLLRALSEKYGKPARSHGNMAGSAWTKAMTVWEGDLPADLSRIILALRSEDGSTSSVTLLYIYRNLPGKDEQEKLDREAL